MLVLRLLVMVLTMICLMDGHAEVSSSTTGIRDRRESPATKTNETEVEVLDRKKKKKPKPNKKKKPKPGKKKPKPNKAKPKPTKPVTTTTTMSTSTLKTTTILTTPTITTTATTTTTTVSPTTTETTVKTTTSTASATTTLSTTTSATTTTTVATSSTASTTITTIPTTATTSSPPTTAATTADSGAGGECKATNGKPCIFPFKDGKEYNECKNEGGKYFWCATSVYDSGKYKHWSYCSTDGPCPLEGDDEECKATNNKPCVFPFKDGNKEYNECADHGGKYFWCATGTNSAGKYTAWSECPKDGSCPLPQKSTTPAMTSTTTGASTTPPTTGTTARTDQMEEKVLDTLENLVLGESRDDSLQMAHMLDKKLDTIIKDLEGETSKTKLTNSDDIPPQSGKLNQTIKISQADEKVRDGTELGEGLMFVLSTVDSMKSVSRLSGDCCQDCTSKYPDTELAEYWDTLDTCYCYKKMKIGGTEVEPKTRPSIEFTTKACDTTTEDKCCETLMISSTEGTAEYQGARLGTYKKDGEHNNKPVYKQQGGSKILFFSELPGFEWVVGSSFSSGGGLRSKPSEDPACPSDAMKWEYYLPGTTNTWIVDSTLAITCQKEFTCSLTRGSRDDNLEALDCPHDEDYWEKYHAPYKAWLYILEEWDLEKKVEPKECAKNCEAANQEVDGDTGEKMIKCKGFQSTPCKKCRLLTDDYRISQSSSVQLQYPQETANMIKSYCIKDYDPAFLESKWQSTDPTLKMDPDNREEYATYGAIFENPKNTKWYSWANVEDTDPQDLSFILWIHKDPPANEDDDPREEIILQAVYDGSKEKIHILYIYPQYIGRNPKTGRVPFANNLIIFALRKLSKALNKEIKMVKALRYYSILDENFAKDDIFWMMGETKKVFPFPIDNDTWERFNKGIIRAAAFAFGRPDMIILGGEGYKETDDDNAMVWDGITLVWNED